MKKHIVNFIFVFVIFVFLTASLFKTMFYPKAINYYENRKAVTLKTPSVQSFADGSLQDNVEDAITDQAFFAQKMKKAYNIIVSGYMKTSLSSIARRYPEQYIRVGTYYLYDKDNLLFAPYDFASIAPSIGARAQGFNELFQKYPDLGFYIYYIEKDTDINFEANAKIGVWEYINEQVNLPRENKGVFEINSFNEFDKYFYKTDHHWNAEGSYKGYKEVVSMLLPDEAEFIEPQKTVDISDTFSGSKTLTEETAMYSERFSAYEFEYPEMTVYISGVPALDYGNQASFLAGSSEDLSYGAFYGGDLGEIIFDTARPEKENLLVVGESYDNAILKLVASHFNRTVSVDMRYYKDYMGKDFSFEECLKANNIDKVLFIGNIDYFVSDIFEVEK